MNRESIDDEGELLDVIIDLLAAHGIVEVDPAGQCPGAYKLTALGETLDVEMRITTQVERCFRRNVNAIPTMLNAVSDGS